MHKSDTVYENKHHHRHENVPKNEFILNSAPLARHARLMKVVGGQY